MSEKLLIPGPTKPVGIFSLFLLVLITVSPVYGQKNFLPGQITTLQNETIEGYIDYRNWDENPQKITFTKSIGSSETTYLPTEIHSFQVNQEYYVAAEVEIEISSRHVSRLDYNPKLNIKPASVFLLTLVKGEKELLYVKNNSGIENFYINHNGTYELLRYKRFVRDHHERKITAEYNGYVDQLTFYLSGCQFGKGKFQNTKYHKGSLTELFNSYYQCTESSPQYVHQNEKITLDFGLMVGASMTSVEFNTDQNVNSSDISEINFEFSNNFSGGVFINFNLPRTRNHWSIANDLIYTSYYLNEMYYGGRFRTENNYRDVFTEFGFSYIKLNNMVRYSYPLGNLAVNLGIGFSNGFILSEDHNYQHSEIYTYGRTRTVSGPAIEEVKSYEQGYLLGLGTKFMNYSIDFRYERSTGISKFSALSSPTDRFYLFFGYSF